MESVLTAAAVDPGHLWQGLLCKVCRIKEKYSGR
jgi:hypothetical protein